MPDTLQNPVRYPWHYFAITLVSCIVLGLFLPPVFWSVLCLGSTIWVYVDARSRGIPRAGVWALNTFIAWIAMFPFYLYRRNWPERPCPSVEGRSPSWVVALLLIVVIVLTVLAFSSWKEVFHPTYPRHRSPPPRKSWNPPLHDPELQQWPTVLATPGPQDESRQERPNDNVIDRIYSVTPPDIHLLGVERKGSEVLITVFVKSEDWDRTNAQIQGYLETLSHIPDLGAPYLNAFQRADILGAERGSRIEITAPLSGETPIRSAKGISAAPRESVSPPAAPFQSAATISLAEAASLLAAEAASSGVKVSMIALQRPSTAVRLGQRSNVVVIQVTIVPGRGDVLAFVHHFEEKAGGACRVRSTPEPGERVETLLFDCAASEF